MNTRMNVIVLRCCMQANEKKDVALKGMVSGMVVMVDGWTM